MQRCDLLQVCCGKNLAEIVGWRLIGSYLDWDVAVECVSPSFVLTCDTKCCVCVCVRISLVVGCVIAVYWSPAAWCLRNEGVSSVLLGASSADQLMENIGAIQVSVCLCVCVCVILQRTVRGVFVRMSPDLLHQALHSCLSFPNSSPPSKSTPASRALQHALVLYCTPLIRSAQYL